MQNEITYLSEMFVEDTGSTANDRAVVDAARVSVGQTADDKTDTDNKQLVRYLLTNRHGSPFEHAVFSFYVSVPLFVAREMMRHRMASWNEVSGRYTEMKPRFYIPPMGRNLVQVGKPGAYSFEPGSDEQYAETVCGTTEASSVAWACYRSMLESGIAREVSRMVLPLNLYTEMRLTINARSLMNFLSLRTVNENAAVPSFPQWEITQAADRMEKIFEERMPWTYEAFNKAGRVAP